MAKQNKPKKDVILLQSNVLTESRYNFSKIEKNCLYKIIEKVRWDYIEHPNSDTIEGYHDMIVYLEPKVLEDITNKAHRKDAHDALVNLRKRDVEIHWEDGSWMNCGFINWCEYDAKNQVYKVEVSSRIMPYLVDLAKCYTSYSLTVAIALKSTYSQRFYELCCQYKNNIETDGFAGFHKTQQQIREMFCLEDKYKDNQDFNRYVVNKAQKELQDAFAAGQCDLYFNVNIKGRGKDMTYDFKVITREQSERQKVIFDDLRKKWIYLQKEFLAVFKRDQKFVQRVLHDLDFTPGKIEPVYLKYKKLSEDYSGADLARLLRYILKEDFDLK